MRTRIGRHSPALIAFLFTSVAAATVRPPIQVRLADEPIVIEAGRPFSNVLEIRAGIPLQVGDVTLSGTEWTVDLQLHKAQLTAPAGELVRIPFTATPHSDGQPLQLEFSYEGGKYTTQLNVSPRDYRRARTPGEVQVVQVPDADVPARDLARPEPVPSSMQVETREPGAAKAGHWVRVLGRFGSFLPEPAGQFRGSDSMGVYIMVDAFPDYQVASGVTNAQGYFDVSFWREDCPSLCYGSGFIYVRFETANGEAVVRSPGLLGGTYVWNTGSTYVAPAATVVDVGTLAPGNPAEYAAPHFLTSMMRTWRWFNSRGYDTDQVIGFWPEAAGAWYQPAFWPIAPELHLGVDSQWEDSIISHEWGHHWLTSYALSPTANYCNAMCDEGGCTHCLWCAETTDIAYTEGAPDWMGDIIPRGYPAQYGGSISGTAFNFEYLVRCDRDNTFHSPLDTEGFFASLLRDMEDATQDIHWEFAALGNDQMANATAAILYTIDAAQPTNPMAFLNMYKAFYPAECEVLWATAKNCGYEIDVANPGVVTSLSSSHGIGVGLVDNTVDFSWIRASDDCSGTSGYSISIAGSSALPDATAELGNVTNYTSGVLAPGSYYFNIRALDNSGKWSGSYVAYGPVVILTPPPVQPNLAFAPGDAFWAHSLVPRPTADASILSAPNPAALSGDDCSYWNARYGNYGTATFPQPSSLFFYVDQTWWDVQAFNDPGSFYGYVLNRWGFCATGGRHTLWNLIDGWNEVGESNEYDNWWGHQWVFTPTSLSADVPVLRSAPPEKYAGHSAIVDGSIVYQNRDGVRVSGASYWTAVVMHSDDPVADYDLELFYPSANADSGFESPLAGSYRMAGESEAVVLNHNWVGWGTTYDVGVVNYNSAYGDYSIQQISNEWLPFDAVTNGDLATGQVLRLWETYLDPATQGSNVTLRVRKSSGPGLAQLRFSFMDSSWNVGATYNGPTGFTDPSTGFGYLELNIPSTGYYGVVIQRDVVDSAIAETIEVSIVPSPPDFQPGWEAMWWSPLVPRAANDGTTTTVLAPTLLPGDQSSTYFNINTGNWGYGSAASVRSDIDFDGTWSWYLSYFGFPAFANWPFNWDAAWYIPAGRHSLALRTDGPNEWSENIESNNHWGEQWIWDPQQLAYNTPALRAVPPDPFGGWTNITSGEPLYLNVDAVRSPSPNIVGNDGYWTIVAAMPGASSDVDLQMHNQAVSAKDGLNSFLAGSYWIAGESDFVIRNYNLPGPSVYDVGVSRFSNNENYSIEADRSVYLPANPGYAYGPFDMDSGEIVDIYEVYLVGGDQQIAVYPLDGVVDYGLSVHPTDHAASNKTSTVGNGWANSNGPGQWEHVTFYAPGPGFYGVVVWKSGSADLYQSGQYRLAMLAGATDVADDSTPLRTQIASIQPNPFNPRTTIQFDVAKAGSVSLQIFDLRGHMLRTLLAEPMPVGRHEEIWDGVDDRGHSVASGVYIVQLASAGTIERQKIVLLK